MQYLDPEDLIDEDQQRKKHGSVEKWSPAHHKKAKVDANMRQFDSSPFNLLLDNAEFSKVRLPHQETSAVDSDAFMA